MNVRLVLALVALVDLAALTGWALYQHGPIEFVQLATANAAVLQTGTDLYIALAMLCGVMIVDARKRGVSWVPYVLAAPFVGSFAPLAYLIRRELTAKAPTQELGQATGVGA